MWSFAWGVLHVELCMWSFACGALHVAGGVFCKNNYMLLFLYFLPRLRHYINKPMHIRWSRSKRRIKSHFGAIYNITPSNWRLVYVESCTITSFRHGTWENTFSPALSFLPGTRPARVLLRSEIFFCYWVLLLYQIKLAKHHKVSYMFRFIQNYIEYSASKHTSEGMRGICYIIFPLTNYQL